MKINMKQKDMELLRCLGGTCSTQHSTVEQL